MTSQHDDMLAVGHYLLQAEVILEGEGNLEFEMGCGDVVKL